MKNETKLYSVVAYVTLNAGNPQLMVGHDFATSLLEAKSKLHEDCKNDNSVSDVDYDNVFAKEVPLIHLVKYMRSLGLDKLAKIPEDLEKRVDLTEE